MFFYKKFIFIKLNFPRIFSHLGFGLLIMAITLNYFFSREITAKIYLGENFSSQDIKIKFGAYIITLLEHIEVRHV